jgi:hypothetical protein
MRPGQTIGVVNVIPTTSPESVQTTALIKHLRSDVIPEAERGTSLNVLVSGATAISEDFGSTLVSKLPMFVAIIVGLRCLLMMLAFRSILIPLIGVAMNLLTMGAAFGLIVAVFQWGWGSEALGAGGAGPVEAFVPVIVGVLEGDAERGASDEAAAGTAADTAPITAEQTDDVAAPITDLVAHLLALAETWTAWDGTPFPVDDRVYTPHKAVRRTADHFLDHLAELEARLVGEPPQPDHWHASASTTEADLAPFTAEDLDEARSRLTRIAQIWRNRLSSLTPEQLDHSPGEGWTFRELAEHLAGSVYYADAVGPLHQGSSKDPGVISPVS